eukprot:GHVL01027830.1.p1 GENE.GHVL01027830.1~~GHVL01027830.1.p1  ORF type:complete len:821 (-),score=209.26 GHVL01027830.1:1161-3623(-)
MSAADMAKMEDEGAAQLKEIQASGGANVSPDAMKELEKLAGESGLGDMLPGAETKQSTSTSSSSTTEKSQNATETSSNSTEPLVGAPPMSMNITWDFEGGKLWGWNKNDTIDCSTPRSYGPSCDEENPSCESHGVMNAFDSQPTRGDNSIWHVVKLENGDLSQSNDDPEISQGDYFIGTFENFTGGPSQFKGNWQGNCPMGVLKSDWFLIPEASSPDTFNTIAFLIGGSDMLEYIYVELIVKPAEIDGETQKWDPIPVRRTTGHIPNMEGEHVDENSLIRAKWYIDDLRGLWASIHIVDASEKGYINVDDFQFFVRPNHQPEGINWSFETDDLSSSGWTPSGGGAMKSQPTLGDNRVYRLAFENQKEGEMKKTAIYDHPVHLQGRRFIGTLENYGGKIDPELHQPGGAGEDIRMGMLESKTFIIKRKYISFWMGGIYKKNKEEESFLQRSYISSYASIENDENNVVFDEDSLYVSMFCMEGPEAFRLVLGKKPPGKTNTEKYRYVEISDETMHRFEFDITERGSQTCGIRIVDNDKEGHINVDTFEFYDYRPTGGGPPGINWNFETSHSNDLQKLIASEKESPELFGWTVEGQAFDFAPTLENNIFARNETDAKHMPGYEGAAWISTYERVYMPGTQELQPAWNRGHGGIDGPKQSPGDIQTDKPADGIMTSESFEIETNTLSFLIGGNSSLHDIYVELQTEGNRGYVPVIRSTGNNEWTMREVSWWIGDNLHRRSRILIVDKNAHAHIEVDNFQFTIIDWRKQDCEKNDQGDSRPAGPLALMCQIGVCSKQSGSCSLAAQKIEELKKNELRMHEALAGG